MNSIRLRTAALVAVCIKALLVIGGLALMVVLRAALTAQFDDALAARAEALRSLTRSDGTKVEMDFAGEAMPRYESPRGRGRGGEDAGFFVAWVRDGQAWRVLERSESVRDGAWPIDALRDGGTGTRDVPLPDGTPGRGAVLDFIPSVEHDEAGERAGEVATTPRPATTNTPVYAVPRVRLLVAMSRGPLDRTLTSIGWSIFGVGVALALASVLLVRWAVGRGLRPLTDLSRRVQTIGPETLGTRFETHGLPAELRPIAEQLSGLLGRLQEAFEREKRFSAAASHELRTPIAELRMLLEVAASQPRTGEEWSRTAETALGVLARAQSLCETLLRLSRASAVQLVPDAQASAKVGPIIAEQTARAIAMHGGDARLVRIDSDSGLVACVDAATLTSILGNLLDNALRHGSATPDDPVIIHARGESGFVHINITNPAPTLTGENLAHLFEPFWRKDPSPHNQDGFGLGLSVARTLSHAIGGELKASINAASTLMIHLSIQAVPEREAPTP